MNNDNYKIPSNYHFSVCYISNLSKLLEIINMSTKEITFFNNQIGLFENLNSAYDLQSCINNIINLYKCCCINLKRIQKHLQRYYEAIEGFDQIGANNRSQCLQNELYNTGLYLWQTVNPISEYKLFWKFPDISQNFKASYLPLTEKRFTVKDMRSVKWKTAVANVAVSVLFFAEGALDGVEQLCDFALSVVGFVADKTGHDDIALWCRDAIPGDISREVINESIQNYKDLGFDIDKYANTDGINAQISSMVGSIAIDYLAISQFSKIGNAKAATSGGSGNGRIVRLLNGLFEGTQAYGRTMETELSNGANWNASTIIASYSSAINFFSGEFRGIIANSFVGKDVIKAKEIFGKSIASALASMIEPLATKILDTSLYENSGNIDSVEEFIKQLHNNMKNDGTYRQMIISGITSTAATLKAGFINKKIGDIKVKTINTFFEENIDQNSPLFQLKSVFSLDKNAKQRKLKKFLETQDTTSFFDSKAKKDWFNKAPKDIQDAYTNVIKYIYSIDTDLIIKDTNYRSIVESELSKYKNVLNAICNKYDMSIPLAASRTIQINQNSEPITLELKGTDKQKLFSEYKQIEEILKNPVANNAEGKVKKIVILDQSSYLDYYFDASYNACISDDAFFSAGYAGGQNGTITILPEAFASSKDELLRTFLHESGHVSDFQFNESQDYFSKYQLWSNAIKDDEIYSGRKGVSGYALTNNIEDFAESYAGYLFNKNLFVKYFPNRAKVLEQFFIQN